MVFFRHESANTRITQDKQHNASIRPCIAALPTNNKHVKESRNIILAALDTSGEYSKDRLSGRVSPRHTPHSEERVVFPATYPSPSTNTSGFCQCHHNRQSTHYFHHHHQRHLCTTCERREPWAYSPPLQQSCGFHHYHHQCCGGGNDDDCVKHVTRRSSSTMNCLPFSPTPMLQRCSKSLEDDLSYLLITTPPPTSSPSTTSLCSASQCPIQFKLDDISHDETTPHSSQATPTETTLYIYPCVSASPVVPGSSPTGRDNGARNSAVPSQSPVPIVVEESLRCIDVCNMLTLKLNVASSPTWTIVEYIADQQLERSLEDQEEVLEVYLSWGPKRSASGNKFFFRQNFRKYEFFHTPQQFFPLCMVDFREQFDLLAESTDLAKVFTLHNQLHHGDTHPVIRSVLYFRTSQDRSSSSWKLAQFLLENGVLSVVTSSQASGGDSSAAVPDNDLSTQKTCLVGDLSKWNIYEAVESTPQGPTPYQFCLRPSARAHKGASPIWFSSEHDAQRQCWIIAFRLAIFGKKLRESYREARQRFGELTSDESKRAMSSAWVAMDFSGPNVRVVEDPKEAEAIAAAEAHNWKRKLPICRSTGSSTGGAGGGGSQSSPVANSASSTAYWNSDSAPYARGGYDPPLLGIHHTQPWFYSGMTREEATQLLTKYGTVDGVFLVRQSLSKPGLFVLCYVYRGKVHHAQIYSVEEKDQVCFSLDMGKTKFYDLLQLIEFYQLNLNHLPTKLTHFLVHHPKNKSTTPPNNNNTEAGAPNL